MKKTSANICHHFIFRKNQKGSVISIQTQNCKFFSLMHWCTHLSRPGKVFETKECEVPKPSKCRSSVQFQSQCWIAKYLPIISEKKITSTQIFISINHCVYGQNRRYVCYMTIYFFWFRYFNCICPLPWLSKFIDLLIMIFNQVSNEFGMCWLMDSFAFQIDRYFTNKVLILTFFRLFIRI
jgi:hypothetical protein